METKRLADKTFSLGAYGTKLHVSIVANSGYTAGTVSVAGAEKNDEGLSS